jgi:hypothetical protein
MRTLSRRRFLRTSGVALAAAAALLLGGASAAEDRSRLPDPSVVRLLTAGDIAAAFGAQTGYAPATRFAARPIPFARCSCPEDGR